MYAWAVVNFDQYQNHPQSHSTHWTYKGHMLCVCVLLTAVEKATGVRQTSGHVGTTCSSYDTLSRELGSISQGSVTVPASGNNCTPERANRALSVARTLVSQCVGADFDPENITVLKSVDGAAPRAPGRQSSQ